MTEDHENVNIKIKGYAFLYVFCYLIYNFVIFLDRPVYFFINLFLAILISLFVSFLAQSFSVVHLDKKSLKFGFASICIAYLTLSVNIFYSYGFNLNVFLISHSELHKFGGNYGWNFVALNFSALLISYYIVNAKSRALALINLTIISLSALIIYSRNPALIFFIILGFYIAPGAIAAPVKPRYVFLGSLAVFFLVIVNNRRAIGTIDFLKGKGFENKDVFNYFLASPEFSVASRISRCLEEYSFGFNDVIMYFSSIFLNFLGLANYEDLYSVKFSRLCGTTGGFNDLYFLTYLTWGIATLVYFVLFCILVGSLFFIMNRLRRKYYTIYLSAGVVWLIINSFRIDLAILSRMYLSIIFPVFLFFILSHIRIKKR